MKAVFCTLMLAVSMVASTALAESPRVRFDAPQTVAVRDVTTRDFAFVHPDERLIEASVSISMLVERGDAADVRELVQRLESSTAAAQVFDFAPKTQLATTIVGTTNVERTEQHEAHVAGNAGGGYYGIASASVSGEYQQQGRKEVQYTELPALEVLTASGTLQRGRGVYFKLKPSSRTTLEGANAYHVVLRVPRAWRAGFLYVTSEAAGREAASVGRARFVVAMYQQGDVAAQRAVQAYAQAELDLRRAAHDHRAALQDRMYPTIVHKLGVTRDGALPKDWYEQIVFRGAGDELIRQLPTEVRRAAEEVGAARRALSELNRPPAVATNP